MILANGKLLPSGQSGAMLKRLEEELLETLAGPPLDALTVVEACGRLTDRLDRGDYAGLVGALEKSGMVTPAQLEAALSHLRRESLLYKLRTELGEGFASPQWFEPPCYNRRIQRRRMPLGVLLHIAAGNAEALPAYSVAEGLLSGNINLLKLPSVDDGLSVRMLQELTAIEPRLAPYIYVFDTPSSDLETLQRLAGLADGIAVWGGDAPVRAVRRFAPPGAKLIEWGHRLSFAYVTAQGAREAQLEGLARHIFQTNQLLCSSCQGIFYDADDMDAVYAFCERLLPVMDRMGREWQRLDIGMQAQVTLRRHTRRLEGPPEGVRVYDGETCSVTAAPDSRLELSQLFGSCWVKPLPRRRLVQALRPHKGCLQTAGLLCGPGEREALAGLLCRAGVTRVTAGADMSRMACGEAHDGEYPLQRYTRLAEVDEAADQR